MPVTARITSNPLVSFTDNFNRADGSLGSNWLTATSGLFNGSSLRIVSNAVDSTSGGINILNPATAAFSSDQEAELTISVKGSFDYVGAGVRMNTNSTGYALAIDGAANSVTGLQRLDGATRTRIADGSWTVCDAGTVFRLRIVGNVLTVFKNNIQVVQIIDSTHISGQPGLMYIRDNINATKGDNFIARDLRNSILYSSTGTRGRAIGSST